MIIVYILITSVLFSLVPIGIKFTQANIYTIGIVRLLVALAGLCLILFIKSKWKDFKVSYLKPMALIGLFFFGHWITYFLSIKLSSASIGLMSLSSYGIFLLILSKIILKNKHSFIHYFSVCIAILGIYLLIPEFNLGNNITLGILVGMVSGFSYSFLPILHKKHTHIPIEFRTLGQFSFGLIGFLFLLPMTSWELTSIDWYTLVALGVLGTLVAHSLWVYITTKIKTSSSSVVMYLNIPITMLFSWILVDEQLNARKFSGMLLIVIGNILPHLSIGKIKRDV